MVGKVFREEKFGQVTLRILQQQDSFVGAVIQSGEKPEPIEHDDPEELWARLRKNAGSFNAGYVGYDGALNRFRIFYPGGFQDPSYREGKTNERSYKVAAAEKLAETLPLEKALEASGKGEAALAAFRATDLLSPFEKTRLQAALRGDEADAFIRGAARFAIGETQQGLIEMEAALKPHDVAKWTAVTYLPYLWKPDVHMFLKPMATKDFAERVGHEFAHVYRPRLDLEVYDCLLDLVRSTEVAIGDLQPVDRIDIQSFIWVVGNYDEAKDLPSSSVE